MTNEGAIVALYAALSVTLAVLANVVATEQADDRLMSHILLWFVSVAIGVLAAVLAGPQGTGPGLQS